MVSKGLWKMKLYVILSTAHLQKETLGAFYIKFYLKHLHKSYLKATQNPQQPPVGVMKKVVLTNFVKLACNTCVGVSFLIRLQETPSQAFSWEFCTILKNNYFVTYQSLPLNPQTYRSLETTTIAKNLETCHKYIFIQRTMLRHEGISVAFFSFKNPLNDKLLAAGCTRFSGLIFSLL